MKYIYLSSTDSKLDHPRNTSSDFTVELINTLSGNYSCALGEIAFSTGVTEALYVYCDLIEGNQISDTSLSILRIVDTPGELHNLYFIKTARSDVQRIRVTIRTKDGSTPAGDLGDVRCTLLLLPIKE